MNTRLVLAGCLSAVALVTAACATAEAQPAVTTSAGHDHDMSTMNMGDPDAQLANAIQNADLRTGQFVAMNDTQRLSGTAWIARHDGGTTVTIVAHGLEASAPHISHVHEAPCGDGAGPHFKFDPAGDHHPPNEIHLAFTTDASGEGAMTVENATVAGEQAVSVVIHQAVDGAPKLMCADLG